MGEAHTCVGVGRQRQLWHELLRRLAAAHSRHLILITATLHSDNEDASRDLTGLLDLELALLLLDLDNPRGGERLALHCVQRRRRDIRRYLHEEQAFSHDRHVRDAAYRLDRRILAYAREALTEASGTAQRGRCG